MTLMQLKKIVTEEEIIQATLDSLKRERDEIDQRIRQVRQQLAFENSYHLPVPERKEEGEDDPNTSVSFRIISHKEMSKMSKRKRKLSAKARARTKRRYDPNDHSRPGLDAA